MIHKISNSSNFCVKKSVLYLEQIVVVKFLIESPKLILVKGLLVNMFWIGP